MDRSQRMKLDYLESTRNQKCILDDSKNVPEKEMNSKEKAFRTQMTKTKSTRLEELKQKTNCRKGRRLIEAEAPRK